MEMSSLLFYVLAFVIITCALSVILAKNPIHSALFLALTMVTLAFIFFLLHAYFIAVVQLAVYAGAVMVLFVMLLMLFDLKKEKAAFAKGSLSRFLKVFSSVWLLALVIGAILPSTEMISKNPTALDSAAMQMGSTKELGIILFSEYLFAFEALGLLLLLIAVGVVAVSRIKGGTHA